MLRSNSALNGDWEQPGARPRLEFLSKLHTRLLTTSEYGNVCKSTYNGPSLSSDIGYLSFDVSESIYICIYVYLLLLIFFVKKTTKTTKSFFQKPHPGMLGWIHPLASLLRVSSEEGPWDMTICHTRRSKSQTYFKTKGHFRFHLWEKGTKERGGWLVDRKTSLKTILTYFQNPIWKAQGLETRFQNILRGWDFAPK